MPKWIVLYGQRGGSVRTSPRGSINFAEGQYALFGGYVPAEPGSLEHDFVRLAFEVAACDIHLRRIGEMIRLRPVCVPAEDCLEVLSCPQPIVECLGLFVMGLSPKNYDALRFFTVEVVLP